MKLISLSGFESVLGCVASRQMPYMAPHPGVEHDFRENMKLVSCFSESKQISIIFIIINNI